MQISNSSVKKLHFYLFHALLLQIDCIFLHFRVLHSESELMCEMDINFRSRNFAGLAVDLVDELVDGHLAAFLHPPYRALRAWEQDANDKFALVDGYLVHIGHLAPLHEGLDEVFEGMELDAHLTSSLIGINYPTAHLDASHHLYFRNCYLQAWLWILLTSLSMGILLHFFIHRVEPYVHGSKIDGNLTLKTCYWFVYGAILKQGFTLDPKTGE